MSKAYTVVAILQAKPEKVDALKQELIKVIAPSRAEKACLNYHLHQDLNDPTQFVLYENWASKQEHEKQFEKPYIVAFAQKAGDWLAKPYQVICAQEIDG